jgi:5'-deoxynucleotidase YfbR-like HD superfamily hydrolase
MKERRTDRSQQAANYFDEGFRALFKRYTERTLTPAEFVSAMDELKQAAEDNCRKDIIQAFNNGFYHGVMWHIETTSTQKEFEKPNGDGYYSRVFEGGEYDT